MDRPLASPIDILLIEDNPGDVDLTRESFKTAKVANRLHVAADGEAALRLLREAGPGRLRPDLILLDLNLPGKTGHEILAEVKADNNLKQIPVVILTSSKAEQDIARSYGLHANCYITKPVIWERFQEVVQSIEGFWLSIVRLPGRKGS